MAAITVETVENQAGLRSFLGFPERLYRDDPLWVAPLRRDQKALLSPANPYLNFARLRLLLARRGGEVVGRVAGIIDRRHATRWREEVGLFGFFESMPDEAIARALLDTVRSWIRSHGMATLRGPINPSIHDVCGLLIAGFQQPPRFLMPYNPAYYPALMEGAGLRPAKDLLSYDLDVPELVPDRLNRLARIAEGEGGKVRPINLDSFREEVAIIHRLYNQAWEQNWGFIPMSPEEGEFMASRLRPLLIPDLALIAEWRGQPVGFSLSLPDYNPALRAFRGRMTPWGLIRYLHRRRSLDVMRVLALGILPAHRRMGVDALLLRATYQACQRRGYHCAELSWIAEDNLLMRRTVERLGARATRRYRLYESPV